MIHVFHHTLNESQTKVTFSGVKNLKQWWQASKLWQTTPLCEDIYPLDTTEIITGINQYNLQEWWLSIEANIPHLNPFHHNNPWKIIH